MVAIPVSVLWRIFDLFQISPLFICRFKVCNLFPLWYADADIYDKIIENSMQSGKDSSTLVGSMLLNIL